MASNSFRQTEGSVKMLRNITSARDNYAVYREHDSVVLVQVLAFRHIRSEGDFHEFVPPPGWKWVARGDALMVWDQNDHVRVYQFHRPGGSSPYSELSIFPPRRIVPSKSPPPADEH